MHNVKPKYCQIIFTLCIVPIVVVLLLSCEHQKTKADQSKLNWGKERLIDAIQNTVIKSESEFKLEIGVDRSSDLIELPFRSEQGFGVLINGKHIQIAGYDTAGAFYGCLALADQIIKERTIPDKFRLSDGPQMKLRGVCILLMKLGTYNYPVTPEEFPFFYDKGLWIEYLDFLVANRFNYIAFWNGHPFAYFTKLEKYPEAQAGMPQGLVEQNNQMLHWLISEANKRNIKLIFEFYNIHTSVYFQKAHNLPDEISQPTPLLEEYTSYCIEKFIREFPDAGLYITAGEALDHEYSVRWVTEVILDAVKRSSEKPQILLRSWFLDFESAKQIIEYYPDIYIERKYNVEMIADTLIDPQNKKWADLSGNYIVNIHMAANLEPFRWNPPDYIQKCIKSSVSVGANGIHLYPRKAWRWPYTADIGEKQLQWERDKLWFEMWGRYAWNSHRNKAEEDKYWTDYFYREYGSVKSGRLALSSFETNADVLPAIQRLFWAGFDNHTVVTSGLMLSQIRRSKGIPFLSLDPVLRISRYLDLISTGTTIEGTSPIEFLDAKVARAELDSTQLESALKYATRNKDELKKHSVDAQAVELTVKFYSEKLKAAVTEVKLESGPQNNLLVKQFLDHLKKSVDHNKNLSELTKKYYESISDVSAIHPLKLKKLPFHWEDILPLYEQEYQVYYDEFMHSYDPEINIPSRKGLVGVCYGSPDLINPRVVLKTEKLLFDWENNPPDDGRNWSASFMGFIKAPISGAVNFHVSSLQFVKLAIDGQIILNKNNNPFEAVASLQMREGEWYPIYIEYDNIDFKGSNLLVEWSWKGSQKESIPEDCLKHSEKNNNIVNRTIILGF